MQRNQEATDGQRVVQVTKQSFPPSLSSLHHPPTLAPASGFDIIHSIVKPASGSLFLARFDKPVSRKGSWFVRIALTTYSVLITAISGLSAPLGHHDSGEQHDEPNVHVLCRLGWLWRAPRRRTAIQPSFHHNVAERRSQQLPLFTALFPRRGNEPGREHMAHGHPGWPGWQNRRHH